ncbi:hypothetical protein EDD17DRAFT_37453 [Pisolithus thermaeus]|nr:hypothetical protein EDD17DRAFT_37453 [Pisolithus thermaeus]
MVGNPRVVEEDDEEENTGRTILKMLLLQQIQLAGAVLAACQIAIAIIQDTTSQESEEEESSFCYSPEVTADQSWKDDELAPQTGDTYNVRMERVHLWRDTVTKGTLPLCVWSGFLMPFAFSDASSSRSCPSKRKLNTCHDADDIHPTVLQNLRNGHAQLLNQVDTCVPLVICHSRRNRRYANTLARLARTKHAGQQSTTISSDRFSFHLAYPIAPSYLFRLRSSLQFPPS